MTINIEIYQYRDERWLHIIDSYSQMINIYTYICMQKHAMMIYRQNDI